MINDYGTICFQSKKCKLKLNFGMNMLAHTDATLKQIQPENGIGSSVCLVNLTTDSIEIMPMPTTELYINDNRVMCSASLRENDIVRIQNEQYTVIFEAETFEKLDALVDLYLDDQLPSFLSVSNMFISYANFINITDKQAAFILASIDIPELEIKE